MPYRICTFDAEGRLTSILPFSYSSEDLAYSTIMAANPSFYSFVEESLLPSTDLPDQQQDYDRYETQTIGNENFLIRNGNRSAIFDPRVEVTLFIPNPSPYIRRNVRVVQDLTKTTTVNGSDSLTIPTHSILQRKFGPTSGRFRRSGIGYTGGYVLVSNLSKLDQGVYVAPHNNIAGTGLNSYSFEMFFYPTSFSNNFTLLQKGAAGTSTSNWKLGYDSSAGFLQFAWKTLTGTAGYNQSANIVNTAGMTTNAWQHVAISAVRNTGVSGTISYTLSGYFNGANVFSVGVTASTAPETRYNQPLFVGNNSLGTEAFDGYIDSLRFLESGNTSGLFGASGYGFLPYGSGTLGVPTLAGFTKNAEVAFIMNFNGLDGNTTFYAESRDFIAANAMRMTNLDLSGGGLTVGGSVELGVKDVVRYTIGLSSATGYSDPTGFSMNYGPITNAFVPTGTADGYDYAFNLFGIYDNQPALNVYRINYRNDIAFDRALELMFQIDGVFGNRGSSGSVYDSSSGTNPFGRLFSNGAGNCYGLSLSHNSLFLDPLNSKVMSYIMDNGYLASQGISSPSYSFVDAAGINRNLTSTDIVNLRLDILDHQNRITKAATDAISTINSAASINQIKVAKIKKPTGYGEASLSGEETLG
jgi:hypothetical protein